MDDTVIRVPNKSQIRTMLSRLNELIRWRGATLKHEKSRFLSIVKGKAMAISFSGADQSIQKRNL